MIEKKLFVCEYCGSQYEDEETCRLCESFHKPLKKIVSYAYNPYDIDHNGYPKCVMCKMSDGTRVWYHR